MYPFPEFMAIVVGHRNYQISGNYDAGGNNQRSQGETEEKEENNPAYERQHQPGFFLVLIKSVRRKKRESQRQEYKSDENACKIPEENGDGAESVQARRLRKHLPYHGIGNIHQRGDRETAELDEDRGKHERQYGAHCRYLLELICPAWVHKNNSLPPSFS